MAIRIYSRFYDEVGMPWAVTIYDFTYTGAMVEVPMGATPAIIRWSGDGIKYVVGSEATLTYVTNIDMSWLRLATMDQLLVTVWKNPVITAGVWDIFDYYTQTADPTRLWWIGYILADTYSRELRIDPTYTIQATDRLGNLTDYDYEDLTPTPFGEVSHGDDPTPTNRHQRMMTALANALQTVGIALPIISAVNLFEDAMAVTSTDDPLDQLYVDELNFCDEDLELGTCYMVVDRIMRIFKARIFQAGAFWFIQRLNDFKHPDIKYRAYAFSSGYPISYASSLSHVKTVNKTDFALLYLGTEETSPAYKKVSVTQDYGKLTSMFIGFTFEDQEYNVENEPIHWQLSHQIGPLNSNFIRYRIGDNNVMISRNDELPNVTDITKEANRGFLRSPWVPMIQNNNDGILIQMDVGTLWTGDKPTVRIPAIITSNVIKVYFVEDAGSRIVWIYNTISTTGQELAGEWVQAGTYAGFNINRYPTIKSIPDVTSFENLQKIELFIKALPTANQGQLFINFTDPATTYSTWSGGDKHYNVYICVDNVIMIFAPIPTDTYLSMVEERYPASNTIITVIKKENRVNALYPLSLGDAPEFDTNVLNKFQSYSGILNLSSTLYTDTSSWYERYTTTGKVQTFSIANGGTGYVYGDVLTVVPTGGGLSFGGYVDGVSSPDGVVTSFSAQAYGSGFVTGTYATLTNHAGEGCTILISAVENVDVDSASKSLTNWIIDGYAENETPSMIVRGVIRGAADYFNTVQFPITTIDTYNTFLPQDVSFSIKSLRWEGNWIELKGMMIPIEYTSEEEPRKSLRT